MAISCASPSKKKPLNEYMIGNWQTKYIKINMPTTNKTNSLAVFEDGFSNPKSGKEQSIYKKDGTFVAWFKTYDDKKTGNTNGIWKTEDDTLFMKSKKINVQ